MVGWERGRGGKGKEGGREREREGREGGRERGKGGRERGEGGREREREGGKEVTNNYVLWIVFLYFSMEIILGFRE